MSAPTPAQPSEGAVICWGPDVPVGWEFRPRRDEEWRTRADSRHLSEYHGLVEARPPAPKTVMVELLEADVRYLGSDELDFRAGWTDRLYAACAKALEADR